MAIVKDPITGQTGDIGAQNQDVYNADVLGAQKRAERMANKTQTTQSNIVNRAPVAPTAITPSDLQPQAPVTVPTVPTPTTTSSVAGRTESILEQELVRQQRDAELKAKQSEDDYKATFDQITGVVKSREKLEGEENVEELSKLSNKAFNDLQSSQRAQVNAIRELEKNPRGLFGGALDQERQRINREFAMEQADYALTYDVANRNYASAQQTIDRKIALQLEPLKMKLDFQSKFYEKNQDNLSKAQQNTLQALIAKNEREYESEQSRLKTLEDTRLKVLFEAQTNGADPVTLAAIQRAGTPEEAIVAGGSYLQNPDADLDRQIKEAQLSKLNAEVQGLGAPAITNPNALKYAGALGVILGSEKFTKEQRNAVVNAINGGEDPAAVIKNQAKTVMGQTLATDLSKNETALSQLENIDTLLKQYYKNGGKTGVFSGNFEKSLNNLGQVKDPKLVEITTKIALAMQSYRLAVTGTAASVQEDARIDNVFPGITNGEVLNNARTQATIESFRNNIDQSYRNVLGSTYDTLKSEESANAFGSLIDQALKSGNTPDSLVNTMVSNPKFMAKYPEQATQAKTLFDSGVPAQEIIDFFSTSSFNNVGGDTNPVSVNTIKDGSRIQTGLWRGIATGIEEGSKFWKYGLDIALDGGKQAKVTSPFSGEVISAKNDGAWGNSVKVKLNDGRIVRLSHLDNINVKPGQKITTGTYIGNQGNTGKTYGKTGVHLDVTIYKPDGKPYTSQEVAAILGTKLA